MKDKEAIQRVRELTKDEVDGDLLLLIEEIRMEYESGFDPHLRGLLALFRMNSRLLQAEGSSD